MATLDSIVEALGANRRVELNLGAGTNTQSFVSLLRARLPGRGKGIENLTIHHETDGN